MISGAMKNSKLIGWLIAPLLLFFTSSLALAQPKFRPNQVDFREASASGQVKEFLSAMEAQALEAEKRRAWEEASDAHRWAAIAASTSGQLQKALTYADKALEMAEKARNQSLQAYSILQLASVHRQLGQDAKVKELLLKGIEIAKQVPAFGAVREELAASFYEQLGRDFLRQRENEKAVEYLSYALQMREATLAYARRIPRDRTTYPDGRPYPQFREQAQSRVVSGLNLLGNAYRRAGKNDEALEAFERGLSILKETGLKTTVETNLYQGLGQAYLANRDYARALENLQRSLQMAEERHLATQIQVANSQIGNLLLQTQKSSEAVPYFQKAIDHIESTRSLLRSEEFRQSYFEGALNAYFNMLRALVSAGKQEAAFDYSERARSRVFLDVLGSKVQLSRLKSGLFEEERALNERLAALKARLAGEGEETERAGLRKELEEAERTYNGFLAKIRKQDKEQASLMSVEPLTLKQAQELLDPGTTLIEYFVTGAVTYVWIVEKEKLRFVTVELPREKLSSLVKTLRETIFTLGEREKLNEVSVALYKQLIQPLLSHIAGKELIIVPHDVLHYLPFHALLSPEGRYLIENYPIYYLSSASLLQFVKEKRRAKGDRVLALGNPDLGDPRMNLRFAELEAKEIQGLYPKSTVLLKKEATEDKAKGLSPQNDIIHFASHAELSEEDPLSSAILLAKGGKEDGRLEVREIFGMDLKANLVVLSACETGLGKLSSGDELVGLTRAFIYAGTPSVMASLWKVEDSSTAALMASFYKNLKTMTKVEALRRAQLELITGKASSDLLARRGIGGVGKLGETPIPNPQSLTPASSSISTSHPYFWAPFILVGDGK